MRVSLRKIVAFSHNLRAVASRCLLSRPVSTSACDCGEQLFGSARGQTCHRLGTRFAGSMLLRHAWNAATQNTRVLRSSSRHSLGGAMQKAEPALNDLYVSRLVQTAARSFGRAPMSLLAVSSFLAGVRSGSPCSWGRRWSCAEDINLRTEQRVR